MPANRSNDGGPSTIPPGHRRVLIERPLLPGIFTLEKELPQTNATKAWSRFNLGSRSQGRMTGGKDQVSTRKDHHQRTLLGKKTLFVSGVGVSTSPARKHFGASILIDKGVSRAGETPAPNKRQVWGEASEKWDSPSRENSENSPREARKKLRPRDLYE